MAQGATQFVLDPSGLYAAVSVRVDWERRELLERGDSSDLRLSARGGFALPEAETRFSGEQS